MQSSTPRAVRRPDSLLPPSRAVLGYASTDFARALFALFHDFEDRLNRRRGRVRALPFDDGSIQDEIAAISEARL